MPEILFHKHQWIVGPRSLNNNSGMGSRHRDHEQSGAQRHLEERIHWSKLSFDPFSTKWQLTEYPNRLQLLTTGRVAAFLLAGQRGVASDAGECSSAWGLDESLH
jgi:hypothetical protein